MCFFYWLCRTVLAGSSDKIIQPKNDSAKLWFKLAQSFQRGDSIVNSLQMDDGCLVMAKAHSELVSDCCLMPTQQFFSYITRPEHVNFQ